jgi:hypothetical protein
MGTVARKIERHRRPAPVADFGIRPAQFEAMDGLSVPRCRWWTKVGSCRRERGYPSMFSPPWPHIFAGAARPQACADLRPYAPMKTGILRPGLPGGSVSLTV